MENFEEPLGDERRRLLEQELRKDLHQFLLSMKEVDETDVDKNLGYVLINNERLTK